MGKCAQGAAGAAALLGGCDRLAQSDTTKNVLASAETLTSDVQHWISPEHVLGAEYTEADLSRYFKPNGAADPDNDDYQETAAKGFADWGRILGDMDTIGQRIGLEPAGDVYSIAPHVIDEAVRADDAGKFDDAKAPSALRFILARPRYSPASRSALGV